MLKCLVACMVALCAISIAATTLPAAASDQRLSGPAPGSGPYLVFAHYMPCFPPTGYLPGKHSMYDDQQKLTAHPVLFPSDLSDPDLSGMVNDIRIAKQYGIDGFLVDELWDGDTGSGLTYRNTWRRLLKAAEIVGNFKIGVMPDYACLHTATTRPEVRDQIKAWVDIGMQSPAFLRYDGKPVVFPYGVGCPDGRYSTLNNELVSGAEKRDLVDWFAAQGEPISYAPTISVDWPAYKVDYDRDPHQGFQTYSFGVGSFTPGASDAMMQRPLDYWPPSMMLMGENAFLYANVGWRYSTGGADLSESYRHRWQWNVAHRDRYRWIMLVTWNDWGETAIAPSVNHFMAWQPITRYYADWFKTGVQPKIDHDSIEIFHRPHPFDAVPTVNPFRAQDNPKFQLVRPNDVVEALAFLTSPATLVIESGDETYSKHVPAGLQSFVQPFAAGVQSAHIERNGQTVASVVSPVPVTEHPDRQNLWYIGADSTHPPIPIALQSWTDVDCRWMGSGGRRNGAGLTLLDSPSVIGDSSFSATVSLTGKSADDSAGLLLHAANDGSSGVRLIVTGDRQWRLEALVKNTPTTLASGTLSSGGKHVLRFDIVGEYHIAYIDGMLVAQTSHFLDVADPTQLSSGRAGLWTSGGNALFGDIHLASYDPAVQ